MVNFAQKPAINKPKTKKMKQKILFALSLLFTLSIFSCTNKTAEPETTKQETAEPVKEQKVDFVKAGFGNILIDSQTAYKYKDIFEKNIRRPTLGIINDKISQAVWFNREAILLLADSLRKYQDLDGVRIHLMAYDTLKSAPGQYKPHQVSLVMVPTNPKQGDPTKHIDNWRVLRNETIKANAFLKTLKPFDGLNHGELCPKACE